MPRSRRTLAAAILAVVAALTPATPTATAGPTQAERALLRAVNEARAARGLPRVQLAQPLQRRTHRYAVWLLRTNTFAHAAGLRPGTCENLAWATTNIASARAIVRMWLASPGHRANLLWRPARKAGVGVARGPYQGYPDVRVAVLRLR